VELANPRYRRAEVSTTFHGRDLFAPAAAHLACGVDFSDLGPSVLDLAPLPVPAPRLQPGLAVGEVIHVDRFGNLITNLEAHQLPGHPLVEVEAGAPIGLCRTYADVAPGSVLALVGSSGFLEIAVRDGSAARLLGLGPGARVVVRA
jgi:hypothetical protein